MFYTFDYFPEIAASFAKGVHFNTFGGNPVACAIGSAVLDVRTTLSFSSCMIVKKVLCVVISNWENVATIHWKYELQLLPHRKLYHSCLSHRHFYLLMYYDARLSCSAFETICTHTNLSSTDFLYVCDLFTYSRKRILTAVIFNITVHVQLSRWPLFVCSLSDNQGGRHPEDQ